MNSTDNSLLLCRQMIQKGSSSFYKAFSYLPDQKRDGVYVVYAFCRFIDNAVDEPEESPFTLEELRKGLLQLEQMKGHFIWPALRWLYSAYPMTNEPFLKQMKGQQQDLAFTHYNSLAELEQYAYFVAGTVGEMLLPILHEQPNDEVRKAAATIGKAMQLTNIIRDVGEDLARGRRYIPLDLMSKHHYSEADYQNQVVNDAFIATLEELAALAESWYSEGLASLNTYPQPSAFCIQLAASFYAAIMESVRKNEYQVYTKRAYVSTWNKLAIFKAVKKNYNLQLDSKSNRAALS